MRQGAMSKCICIHGVTHIPSAKVVETLPSGFEVTRYIGPVVIRIDQDWIELDPGNPDGERIPGLKDCTITLTHKTG